jgi:hypothetical protein
MNRDAIDTPGKLRYIAIVNLNLRCPAMKFFSDIAAAAASCTARAVSGG